MFKNKLFSLLLASTLFLTSLFVPTVARANVKAKALKVGKIALEVGVALTSLYFFVTALKNSKSKKVMKFPFGENHTYKTESKLSFPRVGIGLTCVAILLGLNKLKV